MGGNGRAAPYAYRYQRRYFGNHLANLKLDSPKVRSSQIVGISATGWRKRRALATSSRATSKPESDSIPTRCTNSVE